MTLFAQKKLPGLLALSQQGDQLAIALVQASGKGKPSVLKLASRPLKQPLDVVSLRTFCKEFGLGRRSCATLLPPGSYRILQLELPEVPLEELAEAMRWRVKEMLDYPVEEASIQVLPIPVAPGRPPMGFVLAAKTERVREIVQLYQAARAPLEVIDVPELAQRNLAARFEEPGRGLAMLSITESGGLLTFTADGALYSMRSIDITLSTLTKADPESRYGLFDRLVLELQRSADNFDRQYSHLPLARLVLLPTPGVDGLHAYLVENLYIPVAEADLSQVMDAPEALNFSDPAVQSAGLYALGLALRADADGGV